MGNIKLTKHFRRFNYGQDQWRYLNERSYTTYIEDIFVYEFIYTHVLYVHVRNVEKNMRGTLKKICEEHWKICTCTHFEQVKNVEKICKVNNMLIKTFLETSYYCPSVTYLAMQSYLNISKDLITETTNGDILMKDHILHT